MADPIPTDIRPESDVYTMLVIIASVFLLTGTVYVAVRSQALFDTWLPF